MTEIFKALLSVNFNINNIIIFHLNGYREMVFFVMLIQHWILIEWDIVSAKAKPLQCWFLSFDWRKSKWSQIWNSIYKWLSGEEIFSLIASEPAEIEMVSAIRGCARWLWHFYCIWSSAIAVCTILF